MKNRITGIEYSADVTIRYVGPDGMALHPGDRVSIEPPAIVKKRNIQRLDMPQEVADWLERFVPWARREIAKAGNVPEKLAWGEFEPPRHYAGNILRWSGLDAMKITNPEVMILGKDGRKMLNVKGIDEKELLDMPQEVAGRSERFMPQERREIAKAGNVPEKLVRDEFGPPRHDAGNIWRWPGSDAKKAEQKAARAKRHSVDVYWWEGNERMEVLANGDSGQCLTAVTALLGALLARMPKYKRDRALRKVLRDAAALAEKYEEEGNADE